MTETLIAMWNGLLLLLGLFVAAGAVGSGIAAGVWLVCRWAGAGRALLKVNIYNHKPGV